jgi:pimeloyl-ACP methyl ester carboxylesterase
MFASKTLPTLAVAGVLICGCVGPVRHEMTTDFPAAVIYAVGTPPVVDGRARFREIFCGILASETGERMVAGECEDYLPRLSDEPLPVGSSRLTDIHPTRFRVLIVPGVLNECLSVVVRPFGDAIGPLREQGVFIEELVADSRPGRDVNAAPILEAVGALTLERGEKLVLVGHSKGAADILHFLVDYPKLAERVEAVVSVAGAINGSRLGPLLEDVYSDIAKSFAPHICDASKDGALNSLLPAVSLSWLAAHPLPPSVRYFSVAAIADPENLSPPLKKGYDGLWHYSPRNDGVLLAADQLIPGGVLLGYVRADHLLVALPLENKNLAAFNARNPPAAFPRKVLLQALLSYVAVTMEPQEE